MRLTLIFLLLIGAATNTLAGTPGPDLNQGQARHLNGHGFLPSSYVRSPWVATDFRIFVGGAQAVGLKTPFRDLDGNELFTLEGSLFYVSLGLGYQQQLGDRFAVGLKADALVRTGSNAESLISEGANVDRSANVWGKYRVLRTESSQFTAGLDWEYRKMIVITPWDFARDIINGGNLTDAQLLSNVKNWTVHMTLDYAHAFSPTLGFRANGEVGLFEDLDKPGISRATHRLGVLGELDLKHRYTVPVGLTLGYTKGFPTGVPNAGLSGLLFGVWYTGQEAFVLGLETGYMTLPVQGQAEKVDAMFGLFNLRYYF